VNISPTEYGQSGVAALGVPQANPIVEQEFFALRPSGISFVTTRLTSPAPDLKQRLCDYLTNMVGYARDFDDLSINVFGVACTGSSYLLGRKTEQELIKHAEAALRYPVVTAAMAIQESLALLNVKRISIVAPYPEWIIQSATDYWSSVGYTVADLRRIEIDPTNVHSIYRLTSGDAAAAAENLDCSATEAIVFTGTGMPTLGAIQPVAAASGLPVMSSNLCLLSAIGRRLGVTEAPVMPVPQALDTNSL